MCPWFRRWFRWSSSCLGNRSFQERRLHPPRQRSPREPSTAVRASQHLSYHHPQRTRSLDYWRPQHRHPTRPPTPRRGQRNARPSRQPPRPSLHWGAEVNTRKLARPAPILRNGQDGNYAPRNHARRDRCESLHGCLLRSMHPGPHTQRLVPAGGRYLDARSALLSVTGSWLAFRGASAVVRYCNFARRVAGTT